MHVAIIMDGSGRWAQRRGLPRSEGHREGARAVRRTIEAARHRSIAALTLFSFSADNWARPEAEVTALLGLFGEFLRHQAAPCAERGIRIRQLGRRDRLGAGLLALVEEAEAATASASEMVLRLAIDHSGREAILAAARSLRRQPACDAADFARALGSRGTEVFPAPDVDLLIRTGGEQRLSDFLLWEVAYAEMIFLETLWPDFGESDLDAALREFGRRERRFGRLPLARLDSEAPVV